MRTTATRRAMLATALLAAVLLFTGCVKYVVINGIAKSELKVTVVSNDTYRAGQLVSRLEDRGFTNDENDVVTRTDDDAVIRWGAAPRVYVEEIAHLIETKLDVSLGRDNSLGPDDYDVIISLPFDDYELPDRSEFEVTIFTDEEERGEELLAALLALGYTNEENYVTDGANEEFNIKWGSAPEDYIEEIAAIAEGMEDDIELDRQHAWDYTDNDIFINMPFWLLAPPERQHFEVTVFCDDEDLGEDVLEELEELGYTNEDNEVLEGPNDEYNIKYGALTEEFVEEIAGLLEERFGEEFELMDIWEDTDRDVFINIPEQ